MRYNLGPEQIKRAREMLKELKKKKLVHEGVLEKAVKELEQTPTKYYLNVKKRKEDIEKDIKHIDEKIVEFQEAIKNKYITITSKD